MKNYGQYLEGTDIIDSNINIIDNKNINDICEYFLRGKPLNSKKESIKKFNQNINNNFSGVLMIFFIKNNKKCYLSIPTYIHSRNIYHKLFLKTDRELFTTKENNKIIIDLIKDNPGLKIYSIYLSYNEINVFDSFGKIISIENFQNIFNENLKLSKNINRYGPYGYTYFKIKEKLLDRNIDLIIENKDKNGAWELNDIYIKTESGKKVLQDIMKEDKYLFGYIYFLIDYYLEKYLNYNPFSKINELEKWKKIFFNI